MFRVLVRMADGCVCCCDPGMASSFEQFMLYLLCLVIRGVVRVRESLTSRNEVPGF